MIQTKRWFAYKFRHLIWVIQKALSSLVITHGGVINSTGVIKTPYATYHIYTEYLDPSKLHIVDRGLTMRVALKKTCAEIKEIILQPNDNYETLCTRCSNSTTGTLIG